jgi:hypothetical protein
MAVDVVTDTQNQAKKPSEGVMMVWTGYDNARTYYLRKTKRCIENWRMYWAHDPELGMGQWPEKSVEYMISQGRQLTQFNFAKIIVDTIAGGIMQLEFEPEYFPVSDEITSLTQAIEKVRFSDKELLDWDAVYFNLVRDGLIHEGVIKLVIDNRFDPDGLGNVGFRNCLPGSVFADPYWKSWGSKDLKKCWHRTMHTWKELASMMPEQADFIKFQIANGRNSAEEYGIYQGPTPYIADSNDTKWGSLNELISQYEMVEETQTNEYAILPAVEGIPGNEHVLIPREIPEMDRPAWLNANYPTWDPMYVYSKPVKVNRCYVRSICPQISMSQVLQVKPAQIQIERLPYFFWASSRANGESDAIIDSIKDPQIMINYMESLNLHKIQIEGGGGSQFADRSKFTTNAEFEDYVANRNNPGKIFEVKPGALAEAGTIAQPTMKSQMSQEAYQMINHMVSVILPHISKVTPSMRGVAEGSQESAKLHNLLKVQSDQQVFTINFGLRIFFHEVYEGYFLAAIDQYSREKLERRFSFSKGKESIILNEHVYDEYGNLIGIRNDVSKLRDIRHKVVIGDKPSSPADKVEQLDSIGTFIQKLGGSSPLVTKYLISKAAPMMMNGLDADEQDTIEYLSDLDMEAQISTSKMNIAKADLETLNALIQAKKLQDSLGQPPQPPQPKEPAKSITYKDLPIEGRIQLAAQAGIKLNPPAPQPQLPPPQSGPIQSIPPAPQAPGQPITQRPQAVLQGA